jgi:hypothetical protein
MRITENSNYFALHCQSFPSFTYYSICHISHSQMSHVPSLIIEMFNRVMTAIDQRRGARKDMLKVKQYFQGLASFVMWQPYMHRNESPMR